MHRHTHTCAFTEQQLPLQCAMLSDFSIPVYSFKKELLAITTTVPTSVENRSHSASLACDKELNKNVNQCTASFRKSS